MLINGRKDKNDTNINEFVNVWFSIYCFKELIQILSLQFTANLENPLRAIAILFWNHA